MIRRPLTLHAGLRFTLGVRLPDPNGTPLPVTGLRFTLHRRTTATVDPVLEHTLDYDDETGIHCVDLDPTITTLAPGLYAYRLTMPDGDPLLGGPITVRTPADA